MAKEKMDELYSCFLFGLIFFKGNYLLKLFDNTSLVSMDDMSDSFGLYSLHLFWVAQIFDGVKTLPSPQMN